MCLQVPNVVYICALPLTLLTMYGRKKTELAPCSMAFGSWTSYLTTLIKIFHKADFPFEGQLLTKLQRIGPLSPSLRLACTASSCMHTYTKHTNSTLRVR